MNSLIEKMQSQDQDFRFMGLNDLMSEIKADSTCYSGDETMENKVLNQVLALVEDKISEVKNQAVKCLGQLIKIIREPQMEHVVDKLIEFSGGRDDELRDISALALKTITAELPSDGRIAQSACAKLTPRLLGQLKNSSTPPEALIETLSILSILIVRFPTHLSNATADAQPLRIVAPLLVHSRPVVRKRAIVTVSQFIPISQPELFNELLQQSVFPNLAPGANLDKQRTTVQLVAAVARHSPQQIAAVLPDIVGGILKAVHRDDDDLRESSLQALEAIILRCPTEIAPYLTSCIQVGNQYIKYDPNYAVDDDDEDMGDGEDDEEEDEELGEEYSDDEDMSYKTRRSATKLLAAVISTRPELLSTIYKDVSPVLISRFGDREVTVKLEIWSTYSLLLQQTSVYGGLGGKGDTISGKRKRDADTIDSDEGVFGLLKGQVPSFAKALLAQLKSAKTPAQTLQAGFGLLSSLIDVLPGSLTAQAATIVSTSNSVLSHSLTTSTAALHLTCLSFLSVFFGTHPASSYSPNLGNITPVLLKLVGDKHPRVAAESFRVFSALLTGLKPVKGDWAEPLYNAAVARLTNHDTDADVRAAAEETIGDLWVCATDVVRPKDRREWEAICRTTGKTEGAVRVITKVAQNVIVEDIWLNGCLEYLIGLLRRSGRAGKPEIFNAIDVLLRSYQGEMPAAAAPTLIEQVKPFLSTTDISLLSQALLTLSVTLEVTPATSFPEIEKGLLNNIYTISCSVLLSGAALDSLLAFYGALVQADNQIASHVVPSLVINVQKLPKAEASAANVARCVAQVVRSHNGIAAGVIAEYAKHIHPKTSKAASPMVILSLLILGELGRFIDMAPQTDIFSTTLELFSADQEDIKAAAAFAAGNIAVGNLHQFLPVIVKLVESDPKKRLLSLHALKEVVTHCSQQHLESVAELLWGPLFANSETSEETTRNVAAACLGKLAITHASRYLPQLHARIGDENPAIRATVVSAIRYTFADSSSTYDELLSPYLVDFLSLMKDADLTVRRLALSALNSAARTKAHLVRDHLSTLLPNLYEETVVRPELIRTVQMGPWTHKVDDGLETRKTAYETMYTLLETCRAKLDMHEFVTHILRGLSDDSDEIKVICYMVLVRLSQVSPAAVAQRLDDATPPLEKTMKGATVTKDTVKQDLERAAELQRSAIRAVAALYKVGAGVSPKFDNLVDDLKKNPAFNAELKDS